MSAEELSFNSLFEMRSNNRQTAESAVEFSLRFQFSIWDAFFKHIASYAVDLGSLSILYLRCRLWFLLRWAVATRRTFNSLFEMPIMIPTTLSSSHTSNFQFSIWDATIQALAWMWIISSFNSLFEMRQGVAGWSPPAATSGAFQFSIWDALHVCDARHRVPVPTFNSLFEMRRRAPSSRWAWPAR